MVQIGVAICTRVTMPTFSRADCPTRMIYRRSYHDAKWHFCQNCAGWPKELFQDTTIEPARDDLCPDCARRATELTCEVVPEDGIS